MRRLRLSWKNFITLTLLFILSLLPYPTFAAQDEQKVMIILDGSGSMWGQIDGDAKIDIARRTLETVLGNIPENVQLGLIAYGHREKGNCEDIETLVVPGKGTAPAIQKAVDSLSPKGKTPLTESVKRAADQLRFTEEKATVILITDGLETCEADPCQLAVDLEKQGIDFTTHVIGFNLSEKEGKQVACFAQETGGMYLGADNAKELGQALEIAVAEGGEVAPEVTEKPAASITANTPVKQGNIIVVQWQGPGEKYDAIQIFDPGALNGEGKVMRTRQIRLGDIDEKSVKLPAPAKVGTYLLRYYHGSTRSVIGETELSVEKAEVSLSAPDQVKLGATIPVEWQGPGGRYDMVEIFDPMANSGDGKVIRSKRLRNDDFDKRKVSIVAPGKPGQFQLRYWNGENKAVLATRELEVIETTVVIEAPSSIEAGKTIRVKWQGPGGRYDAIQLYNPDGNNGEGKVVRSKRLRNDRFDERQASLPAPGKAGDYQLRYWNGENKKVLTTVEIKVNEAVVVLSFPGELEQARSLKVEWQGPGGRYDAIHIFDQAARNGEGKVLHQKRLRNDDFDNNIATLPTPAKPGDYEVRYWNGDNKVALLTKKLTIIPGNISITSPEAVEAKTKFEVTWTGPGVRYDQIRIVNQNGKVITQSGLRNGDFDNRRVKVRSPEEPGQYTLQYWNGYNKAVLAEKDLVVQ